MKAEEKANEIAENNLKWYYEEGTSYDECYQSAMAMAQWKDEQHAKEKQQWIDKAVDFISKRFYIGINNHITSKEDYYTLTELIRDFKQTMKGE